MRTEQEQTWAGDFGHEYTRRSPGDPEANRWFFRKALRGAFITSAIELGCGSGANLAALRSLYPAANLAGVEINEHAFTMAMERKVAEELWHTSFLAIAPAHHYDLAFTKGVLIHIPPEKLAIAYQRLYDTSIRYILIAEYWSRDPVAIPYRGRPDLLWKRDFAAEILTQYRDLTLIDCGFASRLHPTAPQDDLTWFLMEKGQ